VLEYYAWQISRIPLPTGQWGVVCYFRDISSYVEARRTLIKHQRKLEAADRQKDEFLAMLAHELRNPLAPIRNAGEILSRVGSTHPHARTAIATIERQVTHLTRLVDDLLDVSRITQGRIELRRRPTVLSEVIARALETVDPAIQQKRHKVVMVSGHRPLIVNADPERLVQCVANILTNAAKYTASGGEIRIECRDEGDRAILVVSDTGVGITTDLLPRVFDLFVQDVRTLDRSQGGLGIGLSIVKRLVEMHDGTITAASAGENRGATFEMQLPLLQATAPPLMPKAAEPVASRRVMIVDDNEDSANTLGMILRLDGHETEVVYGGDEALERVQSFKPDVVLLDIGLPGLDGYTVAGRIRSMVGEDGTRLVAMTGYGQDADRQRALAAGFADHLVKPVDFTALRRTLAGGEGMTPSLSATRTVVRP
jgi:signal transduction histidine kinase/CheY-like chemotaxis protein